MKLCAVLMNGLMWEATLTADPSAPSPGRLVVMLENDEVLSPEDAAFGEFHIVEATEAERDGLRGAGYTLPNWEPGLFP